MRIAIIATIAIMTGCLSPKKASKGKHVCKGEIKYSTMEVIIYKDTCMNLPLQPKYIERNGIKEPE